MPSERVLIVGGGVAGLSLAIALGQRGILADLVERGDSSTTAGAGLYLVGAATRALSELGVVEAAVRAGAVSRTQAFYTHHGRRLAEIDAEAFWAPCGPCIGIARSVLHVAAIEEVALERWSRGRVLLIGDAAHAMSPNMACGVAMAVEDALVLSELVADATPTPVALTRFEQRRVARVRGFRAQTDRRDRLRRLPVAVRDAFLRLLAGRSYRANYRPLLDPP